MLIGFHGRIGSGKNTCATRLALLLRGKHTPLYELSFAKAMKESAAAALGVTVDQLETWKNDEAVVLGVVKGKWKSQPITIRKYLQLYGTEAHRDIFGQDFWVNVAVPLDLDHSAGVYCVTDVRFPSEAIRVTRCGGCVVRILGPGDEPDEPVGSIPAGGHPSEQVAEHHLILDNRTRDDGYAALDRQLLKLYVMLSALETAGVPIDGVDPLTLLPDEARAA